MNDDLLEIKNRLNIVDVIGSYLRLQKAGSNFRGLCPFHNEKSPSFMVSEEKQIWHCFGCQKGGDIFSFVMEMEGLEFREALKMLAEKAGVELRGYTKNSNEKPDKTFEILELSTQFYEQTLWKDQGKNKILEYLRERGLKDETIKEFRLGYAPDGWENGLKFLENKGYTAEDIVKTGLLVEKNANKSFYDRFRDRIMFPITDGSGKVLGFSARVAPGGDESQAKYVNTPETGVYHKSRVLYGIDKAKAHIKKRNFALLVEGNMDVIAAHQAGLKNAIAVSGTALTAEQIKIIKRYTKNIKMFFDMDAAGQAATRKSIELCFEEEMNVWVVSIPKGKDAADLAKEDSKELIRAVNEAPVAMDYFLNKTFSSYDSKSAQGKKKIAGELSEMVSKMKNEIDKNHWLQILSEKLSLPLNILTEMTKKVTLSTRQNDSGRTDDISPEISLDRKDIISRKLLGLALVYPELWKNFCSQDELRRLIGKDPIWKKFLESGAKFDFDFKKFLNILDLESQTLAEKCFFESRFQTGLNNEIEEITLANPFGEAEKYLRELKKELALEELSKISQDLRLAKERGDSQAETFLQNESKRITEVLASLA